MEGLGMGMPVEGSQAAAPVPRAAPAELEPAKVTSDLQQEILQPPNPNVFGSPSPNNVLSPLQNVNGNSKRQYANDNERRAALSQALKRKFHQPSAALLAVVCMAAPPHFLRHPITFLSPD